ncbi:MAG: hypothetical protein SFX74_00900 [Fimbriimonadaceae bacterium]|nr:hypothetical protein [Fimbriimonadaceae bacterium]
MLRSTYLHSNWEFIETRREGGTLGYSNPEWLPAQVPGHIHVDLQRHGIIPDPHTRMHEVGVQWVDETDWSYRTTFGWAPDDELPNSVLRFEGLDTLATITLNGEVIGRTENMFVPHEFDVRALLREGENDLRIDFRSAVVEGTARAAAYYAEHGLEGNHHNFHERSFIRKVQCMFGWDWGPRLVSCGVWKPVRLVEYAGRILDVHFTWGNGDEDDTVLARAKTVHVGPGRIVHQLLDDEETIVATWNEGDEIELEEIEAWSTENPYCYNLVTVLVDEDGNVYDAAEHTVGFADIRLRREPDALGESFEFVINGEPIWARGANWIPDHSFPSQITPARYAEKIADAKDLNFNMLRVWGGGLYEDDAFYEECARQGILVWQDFPFGCAYYPDTGEWPNVIREEARANIQRLRNYPCLALWCGNNENHQMWDQKWGGEEKNPPRYFGLPLYEDVLPKVVAEEDPGRDYIASSPIGLNPNPPAQGGWSGNNAGGYGDQHNWDVWHGRGDWRFYSESDGRFSSEYGFAASCALSTWNHVEGRDASGDNFRDAVYRWHDKTRKGYETYVGYVELHYPASATLGDWVYYSQLNQRDALRHGVEHYRRFEGCRGSLIWQMNDIWPVQSWAFFDSMAQPKALAYELVRLYDDILLSLVRKNDEFEVWVCNDGPEPIEDQLLISAHALTSGEALRHAYFEVSQPPNSRACVGSFSVHGLSVPDTLVFLSSAETEQTTWRLLAEPKLARFGTPSPLLISLADPDELLIQTEGPVVDLLLTIDGATRPLSENFLTIPEAGVVRTSLDGDPRRLSARSLAGVHAVRFTHSPL